MNILIIIPARYGSTRFPGKPLAQLGGQSMLSHVVARAKKAIDGRQDIDLLVATDDNRILSHCKELDVPALMTPESCKTGTDRALAALRQLSEWPDFVMSLQGDVPLVPVEVITNMLETMQDNPRTEVVTPVHQLSWGDLDRMRDAKKESPFSGTTVILNENKEGVWFSKNILPAIRKEDNLRHKSDISPVWRHIGIYGYRTDILEKFTELPASYYEELEGLEQLRLLENGIRIQCVPVKIPEQSLLSGIDSPEDLQRAERLLW
jgi:3-deoxy-manno-octulosonate cytidylyltransferase (CMP-KDO synthetase)